MPAERHHRQRDRRLGNPGYEVRLQGTLESVASGEFKSLRKAANAQGISRSTLSDRAKGRHTSWNESCQTRQKLTPEEECTLLDWCKQRAQEGRPWSPLELRSHAQAISGKKIGKKWNLKFENRHPELRTARPAKLDPKRAKNFNKSTVHDFFDKYEGIHRDANVVPPEHIWNEDEKGVQMGGGRKNSGKKFYFFKDQKNRYRLGSDNLELVTVMECVSAAGDVMPPSFVLSDGPEPDLRRELKVEDFGSLYTSPNGWSDDNHCENWFKEVFIPHAKAKMVDPKKPIVLIMDGHGSHETLKMERVAYEVLEKDDIEIIIFCFPSKCTHKMQPLDVLIFNSVQKRWQQITDNCVMERIPVDRYNIIPLYVKGTRDVMTPVLIQNAFKKTGLYPVNRNVFTDEDFAPSQASSSVAHVPPSYPVDVPSSDPVEPDLDYVSTLSGSSDNEGRSDDESDSEGHNVMRNEFSDDDDDNIQPMATINDIDDDSLSLDNSNEDAKSTLSLDDFDNDAQSTLSLDASDDDDAKSTHTVILDEPDALASGSSESLESSNSSGLMTTLGRIEEHIGMLTRSMVSDAEVGLKPPPIVSLYEDMELTQDELFEELRCTRQKLSDAYSAYTRVTAALSGAEAHCTIIRREVTDLRKDLDKATKPRTRGLTKTKARFITSKALFVDFDKRQADQAERERIASEKAKQKAANQATERARIAEDATSRTFSGRVRSYKKGDLQALARALLLSEEGTVEVLKDRIEGHLAGPEKAQLQNSSRFSGLYLKPGQARHRQVQNLHSRSSSGVVNNLSAENDTRTASSESSELEGPSSHALPPNHQSPSLVPVAPHMQHPYSQPILPFNPYTHLPPYNMSYNPPYYHPPAHAHTAGSHSAMPNFDPNLHFPSNVDPQ